MCRSEVHAVLKLCNLSHIRTSHEFLTSLTADVLTAFLPTKVLVARLQLRPSSRHTQYVLPITGILS